MREALQRAWMHRGPLACALWPLSLLFAAAIRVRRAAYRVGWFRSEHVGVPVIVVGNVFVGGTGKTPVVQAIVRHLAERGLRVGIIARGYGRSAGDCREVNATSDPAQVGDEPLLHARNCRVPVFVGARRADAARALLRTYPGTDVIVSDDGLQHYALARDIEICLFDERGVGNGWLLPAGPLREPPHRGVDFVLGGNGFAVHRSLAQHATRADGTQVPLTQLPHPLTAVAGIAKPDAFFSMLRDAGLTIERTVALPDHYDFTQPLDAQGAIVCTEKDAVKLWRTRPDAWAVPLAVEIDAAFWPAFDSRVDAKLSSRRGSQTA